MNFSRERLDQKFEEKMKPRENYQRLKLMWKLEDGNKEVQKSTQMNPVENLNLKGCSFSKPIYGATTLKGTELICVEDIIEEYALLRKSHKRVSRNRRIEKSLL